jgi:2-C-methyl-D-erythritol 4-phosphate cytidylyltransferase/2-C-methyl-D-erythritol 2,4-cyclodiphosphate synthase
MVQRVLDAKNEADCIVPAIPVVDTLYIDGRPADRTAARRIQTPQLSRKSILQKAFSAGREYTDESSAIAESGGSVFFVEGSPDAHKLTTTDDLKLLSCIEKPSGRILTGFGIDIHQFEDGKDMTLGGVRIAVPFGFKAHSDGDVAIHALIDALLGAAGFGDIGEFYPDTDEEYRGADSAVLLADTVRMLRECGLEIVNTDMTIVAQTPRLLPYKEKMRYRLSELMGIRPNFVNIKATTAEKMGFVGRKEGVAVKAVANLRYFDWTKK